MRNPLSEKLQLLTLLPFQRDERLEAGGAREEVEEPHARDAVGAREHGEVAREAADHALRRIASECGFATLKHLQRMFKARFGQSMTAYRAAIPPSAQSSRKRLAEQRVADKFFPDLAEKGTERKPKRLRRSTSPCKRMEKKTTLPTANS